MHLTGKNFPANAHEVFQPCQVWQGLAKPRVSTKGSIFQRKWGLLQFHSLGRTEVLARSQQVLVPPLLPFKCSVFLERISCGIHQDSPKRNLASQTKGDQFVLWRSFVLLLLLQMVASLHYPALLLSPKGCEEACSGWDSKRPLVKEECPKERPSRHEMSVRDLLQRSLARRGVLRQKWCPGKSTLKGTISSGDRRTGMKTWNGTTCAKLLLLWGTICDFRAKVAGQHQLTLVPSCWS